MWGRTVSGGGRGKLLLISECEKKISVRVLFFWATLSLPKLGAGATLRLDTGSVGWDDLSLMRV